MNLKLINLMSMNFKLINLMSMNFKLINLMLMDFANKQISYFFPLRCFLSLMNLKLVVFFNAFWCFLVHFGAFWCFFVLLKSYRKKKIKSLKLAWWPHLYYCYYPKLIYFAVFSKYDKGAVVQIWRVFWSYTMLLGEGYREMWPFRHLSKHFFRSP